MGEPISATYLASRASLVRIALVGGVLLAEYLALSSAFDAKAVAERGGLWVYVGQAGALGPFIVAASAALLLVSRAQAQLPPLSSKTIHFAALGAHVLAASLFGLATKAIFGLGPPPNGPVFLWLVGWALLCLASAASLYHGLVGDWRWLFRALSRLAPIASLLGLASWLAGTLSSYAWWALSTATFIGVASVLHWIDFQLVADFDRSVIELEGFSVSVAPVCSGIEGIGLYLALMTGFLFCFRKTLRFPVALLLLPVGVCVVWAGNVVRIAALMLLGARVDPSLAIGSFHSKAGWVLFCAITLGIASLAHSWSIFSKTHTPTSHTHNPSPPWLLPVMAWTAIGLTTSAFSEGHDPLYGLRVAVTGAVLFHYRNEYRSLLQRPTPAAWLVGAAVGAAWLLLPFQGDKTRPCPGWTTLAFGVWILWRTLGAIVVIPLCEELAFRGYLARWLTSRSFLEVHYRQMSVLAIVGSSVAFGLLHERWLLATATGIVYALLLRRTDRIIDAVAAHATSNAVIAIWVLLNSDWKHW